MTGASGQDPINGRPHAILEEDKIGGCWACLTPSLFSPQSVLELTFYAQRGSDVTGAGRQDPINSRPYATLEEDESGGCQACSTPISFSSLGIDWAKDKKGDCPAEFLSCDLLASD